MLLICAATVGEISVCPDTFEPDAQRFVSGVGIPATFTTFWHYFTTDPDAERPSLIINIGIAGAYPDSGLEIGDIVIAESDMYGDIGMDLPTENDSIPGFQPISDSTFGKAFYSDPLTATIPAAIAMTIGDGPETNRPFRVHVGRGCTVNTCTGTDTVGYRRAKQTGAVFESMEGAAVIQLGQMVGIPVCQIRAISNIAARRDMRSENIRRALENLRTYLGSIEEV